MTARAPRWALGLLTLGALILVPLLALVSHNWRAPVGLALVLGLGILYTLHINATNRRLLATQEELRRAQALDRHRVEPRYLVLEIAETALFSRLPQAKGLMRRLAGLGVGVHIDNFGTGHASLAMIKQLPVKAVKLDRGLVTALGIDRADEALVKATLTLVQGLGKQVIAEGVETPEQLAMLRHLRCDRAQGFLIGRPMPVAALGVWRRNRAPAAPVAVSG